MFLKKTDVFEVFSVVVAGPTSKSDVHDMRKEIKYLSCVIFRKPFYVIKNCGAAVVVSTLFWNGVKLIYLT